MALCECGCFTAIPDINKKGKPARYAHGHNWKGKTRPRFSAEHRSQLGKNPNTGNAHPMWNGGVIREPGGYVKRLVGKAHPMANGAGYCYEHRLVMADSLSRNLSSEEVVHHIDSDKHNNAIENLMLFSNESDHEKYHYGGGGTSGSN